MRSPLVEVGLCPPGLSSRRRSNPPSTTSSRTLGRMTPLRRPSASARSSATAAPTTWPPAPAQTPPASTAPRPSSSTGLSAAASAPAAPSRLAATLTPGAPRSVIYRPPSDTVLFADLSFSVSSHGRPRLPDCGHRGLLQQRLREDHRVGLGLMGVETHFLCTYCV